MLKRPGDFEQFLGSTVLVRLYKPVDGRKEVVGTLTGYEDGAVTASSLVARNTAISVPRLMTRDA